MIPRTQFIETLGRVEPVRVLRLLEREGFTRSGIDHATGNAVLSSGDTQLVIPPSREVRYYGEVLLGVVEYLAKAPVTAEDVLAQLIFGPSSIHRFSLSDPLADWGLARSWTFPDVVAGIRDAWRYTAAGVASRREQYTQVPDLADAFVRTCAFGQTEFGSFTLRFYTPTLLSDENDTRELLVFDAAEPELSTFPSRVNNAVHENLNYLTHNTPVDFATKPAALNRNVVVAAAKMFPEGVESALLSSVLRSSHGPTESRETQFHTISHYRIRQIQQYFDSRLDFTPVDAQGYVVDLHRDRPRESEQPLQRVTCEVLIPKVGWRKVQINLDRTGYRRAVDWHDRELLVRVAGMIDRRTVPWTLAESKVFEPVFVEPDQPLFNT